MHVVRLEKCSIGTQVARLDAKWPSLDQVEAGIWEMNGSDRTEMTLFGEDSSTLMFGGGGDWFLVTFTSDNGVCSQLVDPAQRHNGTRDVIIGGQAASYPVLCQCRSGRSRRPNLLSHGYARR
jgi:hypothetical protein